MSIAEHLMIITKHKQVLLSWQTHKRSAEQRSSVGEDIRIELHHEQEIIRSSALYDPTNGVAPCHPKHAGASDHAPLDGGVAGSSPAKNRDATPVVVARGEHEVEGRQVRRAPQGCLHRELLRLPDERRARVEPFFQHVVAHRDAPEAAAGVVARRADHGDGGRVGASVVGVQVVVQVSHLLPAVIAACDGSSGKEEEEEKERR
ncbi:hypothetical protein BHE74_00015081 [Ensete ventricosum]|nr:hypothetical protein BHE74_00015081 [Ensete ventricosum]RZS22808.1 hypothetical protein BHM03_00055636 [Ensete ventricosum]